MNWSFLDKFNSTAFKGWSIGWLWIYTGVVWGACAIIATITKIELPETWLGTWLGGLTLYSGVGYFQQKNLRETDYGYVERKGAANVPASVTTVERGGTQQVGAAAPGTVVNVGTPRPSGQQETP